MGPASEPVDEIDDDSIDENQLAEYGEALAQLENFPVSAILVVVEQIII